MSEDSKGINYVRLAVGAGLLAAAAVSIAIFVPRRRLALVTEPLAGLAKLPLAAAVTAWAVRLWQDASMKLVHNSRKIVSCTLEFSFQPLEFKR